MAASSLQISVVADCITALVLDCWLSNILLFYLNIILRSCPNLCSCHRGKFPCIWIYYFASSTHRPSPRRGLHVAVCLQEPVFGAVDLKVVYTALLQPLAVEVGARVALECQVGDVTEQWSFSKTCFVAPLPKQIADVRHITLFLSLRYIYRDSVQIFAGVVGEARVHDGRLVLHAGEDHARPLERDARVGSLAVN